MTIILGMPKVMPMFTMMGIRISDATVCDTNVATDPEKNKMNTKANHGFDRGNAKVITSDRYPSKPED